ncbi:hypothetical protein D9M69_472800 [compost metagenome]
MHRIDVPSATPDNLFTEGSPTGGVPATTVTAAWLNDVQEGLCAVVEAAGLTLEKGNATQLQTAITGLVSAGFLANLGIGGPGVTDYVKIPFRDKTSGIRRELIIQWGTVNSGGATSGTLTFPLQFPIGCRFILPSDIRSGLNLSTLGFNSPGLSGCDWYGMNTSTGAAFDPGVFQYLAGGF